MAFTPAMIPFMVGGYAVDRMMGGNGMTGLAVGTGIGGMGGFGGIAESLGMSGVSSLPSATASNSLGGGAALLGGGAGIPASTAAASATPISLLGSTTGNANNLYNIGMGGVEATQAGYQAASPLGLGIDNTVMQTPDYVGTHLTSDKLKQNLVDTGLDVSNRDIYNQAEQFRPRFDEVTKSSAEEIAGRTGGYESPLYERAFDSVVSFAKDNPLAVATLGLTALDDSGEQQQIQSRTVGSITKTAYNPPRSQILKIQRA